MTSTIAAGSAPFTLPASGVASANTERLRTVLDLLYGGPPFVDQPENVALATADIHPFTWDAGHAELVSWQLDSRWRSHVTLRLAQLRRGEGDFTGLLKPTENVVSRARDVATRLFRPDTPTPSVVPSEEGDVLFIWNKAKWEVEIEVGPEEVSVWARQRDSGAEWCGSLAEYWPQVLELLGFLATHRD